MLDADLSAALQAPQTVLYSGANLESFRDYF